MANLVLKNGHFFHIEDVFDDFYEKEYDLRFNKYMSDIAFEAFEEHLVYVENSFANDRAMGALNNLDFYMISSMRCTDGDFYYPQNMEKISYAIDEHSILFKTDDFKTNILKVYDDFNERELYANHNNAGVIKVLRTLNIEHLGVSLKLCLAG